MKIPASPPAVAPVAALAFAAAAAVLVLGGAPAPAGAVSTKYFLHDTAEEWIRGEPDGVSITSDGTLRLAPRTEVLVEPEEPYLWDLAVDAERGVAYAGAGDDGWILRVKGDDVKPFFQCAALWSHSLLVDDAGRLFAGTGPEGFIYRIDPGGEGSLLFDADETYVWDMAFGPDGMIYAAYGPGAVVYRIDPESGDAERFFSIDDNHVVCLAFDDEGRLLLGTEGRGLVVRVERDGRAHVLHDTPQSEVAAVIAGPDGTVWAAASAPAEIREVVTPENGADGDASGDSDDDAEYSFEITPDDRGKGVVYRIDAEGNAARHWEADAMMIFDLEWASNGDLLVSTGDDGAVWAVHPAGGATLLLPAESAHVVVVRADETGKGHLLGLANPASIVRMHDRGKRSGTYESEVLDARRPAKWGRIEWTGEGDGVSMSVRAGNTDEPDDTWSAWSDEIDDRSGDLAFLGRARYLQWRVRLSGKGDGAAVRRVRVSALENNVAPILDDVHVVSAGTRFYEDIPELRPRPLWQALPGGVKVQYQFDNGGEQEFPPEQRAAWTQGMRQVHWAAIDPNQDVLLFTLAYRAEDETAWKDFAEEVTGSHFSFNSRGVPDGEYRIRVTASDSRSNPADPRTTSAVSEPFLVDNTPPAFEDVKTSRNDANVIVKGAIVDGLSEIVRFELSVDGEDWIDEQPADGIFDTKRETFEVTVEAAEGEEHSVLLRGSDLAGNLVTTRVLLKP